MPAIDATVGGSASNSYCTEAEANAYFAARIPLSTPWVDGASGNVAALLTAARMLDALAQPYKTFFPELGYYIARRQWNGLAATTTQRMAWPRSGMFDANGNEISTSTIPDALKEAQAELAGLLLIEDSSTDNPAAAQGISSVRAGSVSVTFKNTIQPKPIPDWVYAMMPNNWLTEESISYPTTAEVTVL